MNRGAGLRADDGRGHHDGVGAHGEPAHSPRLPPLPLKKLKENPPREIGAPGMQCGGAAIDVVVALGAGRKCELNQAKRVCRQKIQELVPHGLSHTVRLKYQGLVKPGSHPRSMWRTPWVA